MEPFLFGVQVAASERLAAADGWGNAKVSDLPVAELNTNSPQGVKTTEKHDWDARADRLMFRHEMDHA
jgi:hypothetical protein